MGSVNYWLSRGITHVLVSQPVGLLKQGAVVDQLKHNVVVTKTAVGAGEKQLESAGERRARCRCNKIALLIVLLLVLALVLGFLERSSPRSLLDSARSPRS